MKNLLFIVLLIATSLSFGQSYKPKKSGGLYTTGANKVDKGWFFGIGGTYTVAYPKTTYNTTLDSAGNTYEQNYTGDPKGKFGLFAEIGKFKMNGKRVINYMDYALAYKWLRGGEDYTFENSINSTPVTTLTNEGSFGDHLISGNFRIGHKYDKDDKTFIVNGLGLNLDYHIITGRSATPPIPTKDYENGPSSFLGEMHYFFGMGFKTGGRLMIMPIIETPILALFPFNHIVSTHPYFNGRFRPILFRIRFMFLSKDSDSCPKVYNPMGISPENGGMK